jgi:hypothetical protein
VNLSRYIDTGKQALRDVRIGSNTTVLVFDLSNILSPALQIATPRYVPLFFHLPIDWSEHCAASFAGLMTDVDIVMVPKQPLFPEETHSLLERYGTELGTSFIRTFEDEDWARYDRSTTWPRPKQLALHPSYCRR